MAENNNKIFSKIQFWQFLIGFLATVLGVLTAYYTTIAGIKIDLAGKAENEVVLKIDKKLSQIEIILQENFLTKEEFFLFKENLEKRLCRMEFLLEKSEEDKKQKGN
jgi:hypothetical protein